MFLYPFAFDPAFMINFHASFFWFCTIFSEEDSCFFYLYCVLFHVYGLCVWISVERIVKCLFVLWLQVRIQRGGGGQGVWVSTGNKQLDPPPPWKKLYPPPPPPPPPPGKCWTPSGNLKMIVFFGINHLTSFK